MVKSLCLTVLNLGASPSVFFIRFQMKDIPGRMFPYKSRPKSILSFYVKHKV